MYRIHNCTLLGAGGRTCNELVPASMLVTANELVPARLEVPAHELAQIRSRAGVRGHRMKGFPVLQGWVIGLRRGDPVRKRVGESTLSWSS